MSELNEMTQQFLEERKRLGALAVVIGAFGTLLFIVPGVYYDHVLLSLMGIFIGVPAMFAGMVVILIAKLMEDGKLE